MSYMNMFLMRCEGSEKIPDTLRRYEAVIQAARDTLREADRQRSDNEAAYRARFYILSMPSEDCPNAEYGLYPVTESSISSDYDMRDCNDGEVGNYFYLDDDGKLYSVTCGKDMERINTDEEQPFYFAASDLIANGKVVGAVLHTDH